MTGYKFNGEVRDDNGTSVRFEDFVIEAEDKDSAYEELAERVAGNLEASGFLSGARVEISGRVSFSFTLDLDFDESDEVEDEDDVIVFVENNTEQVYDEIRDNLELDSWNVDYDIDAVDIES
jgi:hypothetical protein